MTALRVPRPPAADPALAFSDEQIRAAVAYAHPRHRWSMLALAADLLVLGGFALTDPGRRLVAEAAGVAGGWVPGQAALATVAVVASQALAGLPFSVRAWRQDVRAGLATQRAPAWLADWLKARTVGIVLTLIPVAGLVLAARWLPGHPLTSAVAAGLLVAALTLAGPVVLEPLFNRFTPLPEGPLRAHALATAARMGVAVSDVLVADASRRTTRLNAYVSGLGRTRRIVLYDNLLALAEREGDDQVLLVLAHELAHVRHRDVPLGTAAGALAAALGVLALDGLLGLGGVRRALGVQGLGDPLAPAGVLLLAAVAGLAAAPVASAISRWSEARADWAALEARHDPASAVAVERRLALDNLADLRPNPLLVAWFASHPPVMARIAQAWLWADRHRQVLRSPGQPDRPGDPQVLRSPGPPGAT
jgi:STE24 endopeptidase